MSVGHRSVSIACLVTMSLCLGANVMARQGQAPPIAPPAPSGSGAISGVIFDGATKQPVAHAVVTLAAPGLVAERQLADSRGRFVFTNLKPGDTYALSASRYGYFDGRYGNGTQAQPIALAEGQWVADAHVWLFRPSVISGTVVDEAGEPIIGIPVRVLRQLTLGGRQQLAAGPMVKTDDRGQYRLSGLEAGRYVVNIPSVQHSVPAETPAHAVAGRSAATSADTLPLIPTLDVEPGHRLVLTGYPVPPPSVAGAEPHVYPPTFYPDARSLAEATGVDVGRGEGRGGIDFQLRAVPAWRVSGRLDAPASAAAGMPLRLLSRGHELLGLGSEAATTVVDATGRFTFLNVPAGAYTIDARRIVSELRQDPGGSMSRPEQPTPGFVPNSTSSSSIAGTSASFTSMEAGDATWWGRAAVDVSSRDVTGIVLTMQRAASASGRVELGDAGMPVSTLVMFQSADGSTPTRTGVARDGVFAISGILPGTYFISTAGAGPQSVTWNGRDYVRTRLDVGPGQELSDILITLPKAPGVITGTVSNLAAMPDGAAVIAFPVERDLWSNYGLQTPRIRTAEVAANGSYRIAAIPAGNFFVAVVDPARINAWQDPAFLQRVSTLGTAVTVEWGKTTTQALRAGGGQ